MNWIADVSRLKGLGWRDRFLLAEAATSLTSAWLAVRLLPFRKLMASLREAPQSEASEDEIETEISRVKWAIRASARRLPWRIVCFQEGLAMYRMLRRRSIASVLHYGVRPGDETGLKAHVWVTRKSRSLIGGEEAKDFVCLASFPQRANSDAFSAP